jgi:ureidoglycolate lyase
MKLTIEPLLPEAFAPFGTVVRAPAEVARTPFPAALGNLRPDARATLSASRALPKTLPLTSTVMERHRHSSQTFLPLDVERYIVLVAPHSATGAPDMLRARAFVVPGDTGISYAADSWHHPMIVLIGRAASPCSCGATERRRTSRPSPSMNLSRSLRRGQAEPQRLG